METSFFVFDPGLATGSGVLVPDGDDIIGCRWRVGRFRIVLAEGQPGGGREGGEPRWDP